MVEPDFLAGAHQSQTNQLRAALREANVRAENLGCALICALRALEGELDVVEIAGKCALPEAAMRDAPHHFKIEFPFPVVQGVPAEDGEVEEDATPDRFVLVGLQKVEGGNGIVVPDGPRLQIP